MGRLAPELDDEMVDGQHPGVDGVVVGRVNHHGCGGTLEGARPYQIDLAGALLFGGGAQHGDPDSQFIRHGGQGHPGSGGSGGDDVVAAGVADAGQGVVFGADDHLGAARSGPCRKGGVEAVGRVFDLESVFLQEPGHPGRGRMLLEGGFGVLVQPMADLHEFGLDGGKGLLGSLLDAHGDPSGVRGFGDRTTGPAGAIRTAEPPVPPILMGTQEVFGNGSLA